MAEIVLLHAAEADVLSIYARYEELRAGRGEVFTADLDHILDLLREFPNLGPIFEGPFHRRKLSRHPYAVFYEVAGNRVIVHAILSDWETEHCVRRRFGL